MIDLPLARSTWDESEIDAINRVIEKGRFTMGENVREFEDRFAEFVGARHAVMVNSGSSANLIAVSALSFTQHNPLKPGDEVIVPAVSWSTSYSPLYQHRLKLKFVDVDAETLNLDLDRLQSAISGKTRAILAVNLLGNANDFPRIREIIGERDIVLLEDNCESLGAKLAGRYAGTFGRLGTFSTFFSHHMTTMEGGVVVTDDDELYHILLSLRAHGWTRDLPEHNEVAARGDDSFRESYRFVLPGYNLRPVEISGAVGLEQLSKLPGFIARRRDNAKTFQDLFGDHPYLQIQKEIGESSWFGFSMIVKPGTAVTRKELVEKLGAEGVECRPIVAGNFTRNDVVKFFDHEVFGALENADLVDSNGLFIGNHHDDIRKELEEIRRLLS